MLIFVLNKFSIMQFKYLFHFLFFCLTFCICVNVADAQRVERNRHGEQIITFPDGKWEYYDDSKPLHRAILKESLGTAILANADQQTGKGGAETHHHDTKQKIKLAEEALALAEEKERDARYSKILLEESLEEIMEDDSATEEELLVTKRQLKLAKRLEKQTRRETKVAQRKLKKLKSGKAKQNGKKSSTHNSSDKVAKQTKKKSNRNKKSKKAKRAAEKQHDQALEMQENAFAYQEDANFYAAAKKFKKYEVEEDVMYHPPATKCELTFDGVDEFLGKKRKDVAREVLFSYTADDMRRYMKDDDYIICEGNLTQIKGGVLLLNLFISINTTDALRSFGELSKGSLIQVKMIDGSKISLANNQTDRGVYDALSRRHTFTAQYVINSGQEKSLKKGEVDMIRIIWNTGYEDYEVYNLDFFKDQFRCLD